MKKRILTGLVVLASMICSTSFAQDIYKTAAGVPMVQLNNGILMPQFGLGTFLQPTSGLLQFKSPCLVLLNKFLYFGNSHNRLLSSLCKFMKSY